LAELDGYSQRLKVVREIGIKNHTLND